MKRLFFCLLLLLLSFETTLAQDLEVKYGPAPSLSTTRSHEVLLTEIRSRKKVEIESAFLNLPWGSIDTTDYPPTLDPGEPHTARFRVKPLSWGGIFYNSLSFEATLLLVTKDSGTLSAPVTITFALPVWLSVIGVVLGALLQYFFGRYVAYEASSPAPNDFSLPRYLIVSAISGLLIFLAASNGIDLVLSLLKLDAATGSFTGAIVIGFFSHQIIQKLKKLTSRNAESS